MLKQLPELGTSSVVNGETVEAYGLATIGLCKGIYEVFIKDSVKEWEAKQWAVAGLLGSAILYDLVCQDGQTISEGFDHYLEKHPVAIRVGIVATAGHLSNLIPEKYDPIHQLHRLIR